MTEKIALSACSGMSANGLVSRVAVDDLSKSEDYVSICIGATSGNRPALLKLIKRFPIIAVNGCENACVNTILKERSVDVAATINITQELNDKNVSTKDASRLDSGGEKCVGIIKNRIMELSKQIE